MSFETQGIERKEFSILKVLSNSPQALGARVIARHIKGLGIELSERAVRYHLRLMDERGLTQLEGRREGRVITELGFTELKKALVNDKVGFAFSKIETLAFHTNFDWDKRTGSIPVNVSFFREENFRKALKIMKPVFQAGLCVSDLVAVAGEGENIGELIFGGRTALGDGVQHFSQRHPAQSRCTRRLKIRRHTANTKSQTPSFYRTHSLLR